MYDDDVPHPAGTRVYRSLVDPVLISSRLPVLREHVAKGQPGVRPITAGQRDGKRQQAVIPPSEEVVRALGQGLYEKGEMSGRACAEFNLLHSLPGCKQQKLHWDYPPDQVEGLRLKPCSVILGMEHGTRLVVRDEVLDRCVVVRLAPGDVLVFDGDVLHAGASYCECNLRLHTYLEVPEVPELERKKNHTWFPRRTRRIVLRVQPAVAHIPRGA